MTVDAAWSTPASVEYYRSHRRTAEELYPSERFFLPEVVGGAASCLDVGCAAGGFARIMRGMNPKLRYTGVDVSPALVEAARRDVPEAEFLVGDGVSFATPSESYDLVHLSGVLHLAPRHAEMVRACWDQARRWLLCDFRLTQGPSVEGSLKLDFGAGGAAPVLPYYVLNLDGLLASLKSLSPAPRSIRARGYVRPPSAEASLPLKEVLMAFFLLEKGDSSGGTRVELDFESS